MSPSLHPDCQPPSPLSRSNSVSSLVFFRSSLPCLLLPHSSQNDLPKLPICIGPLSGLLRLASELSWHWWVWHLDANILPWAYNEAQGPVLHHLGFVVVRLLSHVWLFAIPWTASGQASLSFTISGPLSWWSCPTTSFSVTPFSSFPPTSPASWSFLMSCLFSSGGQSTGALASVLPMDIQGWFLKL